MPNRVLLSSIIAVLLSGCSTISNFAQSLAMDTDTDAIQSQSVPTVRACSQDELLGLHSLYIDSSRPYFSGGSVIIYGRDGSRCRLSMRYLK